MPRRTSRDIRLASRLAVLRAVYPAQPATRQELAAATGLSFATVASIMAELLEAGVLVEVAYEDSGGGRPRARVAVNADRGVLVGVDVGERYVQVDAYDLALTAQASGRRQLHPRENRPHDVVGHVIEEVQTVLNAVPGARSRTPPQAPAGQAPPAPPAPPGERSRNRNLAEASTPPAPPGERSQSHSLAEASTPPASPPAAAGAAPHVPLGVGISLPGLVSQGAGVSVFAPNWSWQDEPVLADLEDGLRLPVYLDNPVKAATVAELWFGAGRRSNSLVTVMIGTGVGAGIALGGDLLRGATNTAGEWGHNTLVMDGRRCRCGGRGCVEAYVGIPGIVRQSAELAPALVHPDNFSDTIRTLAAALRRDDPSAAKVITETARYLGAGLAGLINIFNPDTVVLDGWVIDMLGAWLVPAARSATAAHALARPLSAVTITASAIQQNTVTLGMATFALEGLLGVSSAY